MWAFLVGVVWTMNGEDATKELTGGSLRMWLIFATEAQCMLIWGCLAAVAEQPLGTFLKFLLTIIVRNI